MNEPIEPGSHTYANELGEITALPWYTRPLAARIYDSGLFPDQQRTMLEVTREVGAYCEANADRLRRENPLKALRESIGGAEADVKAMATEWQRDVLVPSVDVGSREYFSNPYYAEDMARRAGIGFLEAQRALFPHLMWRAREEYAGLIAHIVRNGGRPTGDIITFLTQRNAEAGHLPGEEPLKMAGPLSYVDDSGDSHYLPKFTNLEALSRKLGAMGEHDTFDMLKKRGLFRLAGRPEISHPGHGIQLKPTMTTDAVPTRIPGLKVTFQEGPETPFPEATPRRSMNLLFDNEAWMKVIAASMVAEDL